MKMQFIVEVEVEPFEPLPDPIPTEDQVVSAVWQALFAARDRLLSVYLPGYEAVEWRVDEQ